jgi:hypothetical protein
MYKNIHDASHSGPMLWKKLLGTVHETSHQGRRPPGSPHPIAGRQAAAALTGAGYLLAAG